MHFFYYFDDQKSLQEVIIDAHHREDDKTSPWPTESSPKSFQAHHAYSNRQMAYQVGVNFLHLTDKKLGILHWGDALRPVLHS